MHVVEMEQAALWEPVLTVIRPRHIAQRRYDDAIGDFPV